MTTHTATVRREPALVSNTAVRATSYAADRHGYAADLDTAVILPIEASGSRLARVFHR